MIRTLRSMLGIGPKFESQARVGSGFVAVGYPKTGNTWTRIMLGRYVQIIHGLDHLPLFDANEMAALANHGYRGSNGVFTHQPLTWETQVAGDLSYKNVIAPFLRQKVLFLARHPLDTLVSHFMHAKHKVPDAPYPGDLIDFIFDPVHGLDKLIRFHELWAAHHGDVGEFFLWRYEDVRRDTPAQLKHLLEFLGEVVDDVAMRVAVEYASFENLKAMESAGKKLIYKSSGFNAFGDGPRDDPNTFHVRKGEIAGYKNELPPQHVADLEQRVKVEIPAFFRYS